MCIGPLRIAIKPCCIKIWLGNCNAKQSFVLASMYRKSLNNSVFSETFFPLLEACWQWNAKQRFSLYNLLLTVRKRLLRVLVDKFGTRSVASVVSYSWSSRKNKRNCLGALNPTKKRYQPPKKNMHIHARYELAKHVNRLNCTFLYVEVFSNKFANKLMFSCDVA